MDGDFVDRARVRLGRQTSNSLLWIAEVRATIVTLPASLLGAYLYAEHFDYSDAGWACFLAGVLATSVAAIDIIYRRLLGREINLRMSGSVRVASGNTEEEP